jgi:geranylgeranyl pyrophosphate synthase
MDAYLRMVDFSERTIFCTVLNPTCSKLLTHCAETRDLFQLLAKLMIFLSPLVSPPNIDRWATLLGLYFQVWDDYQNLTSTGYVSQKGFVEDLDEGKYSLHLIHTLQSLPRHETIMLINLLTQRRVAGHSPLFEHKTLILELMKRARSLVFTAGALRRLMVEIEVDMCEIEKQAGENPQLRIIDRLLAL